MRPAAPARAATIRARVAALASAAALAAALSASPPAAAQTPLAGAGSFNDAPLIEPGRYADTLRGGEQLFYGVRIQPGQRLVASATVEGRSTTSHFMSVRLFTPLREEAGEGTQSFGPQDRRVELRAEGQPARQGGVAYVSLAARKAGVEREPEQFDTTLDLQLTGTPASPTPSPSPAPTATARPSRDAGGGFPAATTALGLVLGLGAGFAARRLSRREDA